MVSCFVVYAHEEEKTGGEPGVLEHNQEVRDRRALLERMIVALKRQGVSDIEVTNEEQVDSDVILLNKEPNLEIISDHITKGKRGHDIGDYNGRIALTHLQRADYVIVACTKEMMRKSMDRRCVVQKELAVVARRIAEESEIIRTCADKELQLKLQRSVVFVLLEGTKKEVMPPYLEGGTERFIYENLADTSKSFDDHIGYLVRTMRTSERERCLTYFRKEQSGPEPITVIMQLPQTNHMFTGREKEFELLLAEFSTKSQMTVCGKTKLDREAQTTAAMRDLNLTEGELGVVGMGGVGKSQLVREYAQRCAYGKKGYPTYQLIWWISASERIGLETDYIRLAHRLKINTEKKDAAEVIKSVHNMLSSAQAGSWLLIFDDAHPEMLGQWLPDGLPESTYGHVLVSSRHLRWANIIKLGVFSEHDAMTFLAKVLGVIDDSKQHTTFFKQHTTFFAERNDLAKLLGYHPLALAQAAGYIRENQNKGVTIPSYIQMFEAKKRALLATYPESDPGVDTYDLTIQASITLSIEAMQSLSNDGQNKVAKSAKLALECLTIASCLASRWFPVMIYDPLVGEAEVYTKLNLQQAITLLDRYSLAEKIDEKVDGELIGGATLHEMTQAVLWENLERVNQDNTLSKTAELFNMLSRDELFDFSHAKITTWHGGEILMPHIQKFLNYVIQDKYTVVDQYYLLAIRLAKLLSNLGLTDAALQMQKFSITFAENLYSRDSIEYANEVNNYGRAFYMTGRYPEAIQLFEQSLQIKKGLNDRSDELLLDIVRSYVCLSSAYFSLRDFANGKKSLGEGLRIADGIALDIEEDKSYIYHNMAVALRMQAMYKDSLDNIQIALTIRRKKFREESKYAIELIGSLCVASKIFLYYQQPESALLHIEEAKTIADNYFNSMPKHEVHARIISTLGLVHFYCGNYKEAQILFSEGEEKFGPTIVASKSTYEDGLIEAHQILKCAKLYNNNLDHINGALQASIQSTWLDLYKVKVPQEYITKDIKNTHIIRMLANVHDNPHPINYMLLAYACKEVGLPYLEKANMLRANRLWQVDSMLSEEKINGLESKFIAENKNPHYTTLTLIQRSWRERIESRKHSESSQLQEVRQI